MHDNHIQAREKDIPPPMVAILKRNKFTMETPKEKDRKNKTKEKDLEFRLGQQQEHLDH
jgi:hypothetical protein